MQNLCPGSKSTTASNDAQTIVILPIATGLTVDGKTHMLQGLLCWLFDTGGGRTEKKGHTRNIMRAPRSKQPIPG
jgi:hypothetical protein